VRGGRACSCRVAGLGTGGWRSGRVAAAVAMATAEGRGEEEVTCEYPRACNVPACIIHGQKTSGRNHFSYQKNSRLFSLPGFPQPNLPTFTNFS
jgi:hypothetical protein